MLASERTTSSQVAHVDQPGQGGRTRRTSSASCRRSGPEPPGDGDPPTPGPGTPGPVCKPRLRGVVDGEQVCVVLAPDERIGGPKAARRPVREQQPSSPAGCWQPLGGGTRMARADEALSGSRARREPFPSAGRVVERPGREVAGRGRARGRWTPAGAEVPRRGFMSGGVNGRPRRATRGHPCGASRRGCCRCRRCKRRCR